MVTIQLRICGFCHYYEMGITFAKLKKKYKEESEILYCKEQRFNEKLEDHITLLMFINNKNRVLTQQCFCL